MSAQEEITFALIHIVTPALGMAWYAYLVVRMEKEYVMAPPFIPVLMLFIIYGGMLLVFLTAAFWDWSGLATLGLAFEVLVAPLLAGAIAWAFRKDRHLSRYHMAVHHWSLGYFVVLVLGLVASRVAFSLR